MDPRALLIDGLGTLVSLAPPAPALRQELAGRCGIEVSEEQAGRALGAEIAFYRAHMSLGRDRDSLAALRRRCAEVMRDALPPSERLAAVGVDALTEVLLSALRFDAYPDARPALLRARAAGAVRIIVVSNWDVSLADVLERVGLAALVDAVVTSAAVGAAKPAPAIFAHALGLAGVAAENALHVGDSLQEDVRGAAACGIRAVLLQRDEGLGPPPPGALDGVATISGLDELDWP
ncbi:MAG TPA: HAD-IA family hydrolase [Solirubrobacteraceae bacterium]|jgi:putative hydrolase of the HAD superfamily|nr:HAD-IA family hydrolase [Solirubrobacteraceae bacterium]